MTIDWQITVHETVPSTQDSVRKAWEDGQAKEGFCVQALVQTKGRGRHGRVWEDGHEKAEHREKEGNLACSFLLTPDCPARQIGQLALLMGVAAGNTIRPVLENPDAFRLKWPNDALIAGKKCAGILLESDIGQDGMINFVIVGIGINRTQKPIDGATCLADHWREEISLSDLRDKLLEQCGMLYEAWRQNGFDDVRKAWKAIGPVVGTSVTVKIGTHIVSGTFHEIDDLGQMIIRDQDGAFKTINSGDIFL